jgi:hypothetical protein
MTDSVRMVVTQHNGFRSSMIYLIKLLLVIVVWQVPLKNLLEL